MIHYYAIPGLKNCKVKFRHMEHCDNIIESVCRYFNIVKAQLMKRSRVREIVDARYICFYLLHASGMNKSQIAAIFNQDHTTIIHGLKKCDDLLYSDPSFTRAIAYIQKM